MGARVGIGECSRHLEYSSPYAGSVIPPMVDLEDSSFRILQHGADIYLNAPIYEAIIAKY
jgi:hypothetical protein